MSVERERSAGVCDVVWRGEREEKGEREESEGERRAAEKSQTVSFVFKLCVRLMLL